MSRNVTITFTVAIAVGLYLLGGIVTQIIGGILPGSDVAFALGGGAIAAIFVSVVVYMVLWFGGNKLGSRDRPMPLGTTGKVTIIALLTVALAGGVSVSFSRVQEANAAKAQSEKALEAAKAAREAEAQRVAALTPEQKAAEAAKREAILKAAAKKAADAKAVEDANKAAVAALSLARGRAALGAQSLKKSMKDPETFELKEVLFMEDGTACYTYRAKNSFNAMLQGQAVLTSNTKNIELLVEGHDGNKFSNAWNKGCAGKPGEDITRFVKRLLD